MIVPDALVRATEPMQGCETELEGDGTVVGGTGTGVGDEIVGAGVGDGVAADRAQSKLVSSATDN